MQRKLSNYLRKNKKIGNAFIRKANKSKSAGFVFEFEGRRFMVKEIQ